MTDSHALCVVIHDHDKPREATPGLHVCTWHHTRTSNAIIDASGHYSDLADRLTATTGGLTGMPTGSHEPGLTINPRVAQLRTDIHNTLAAWARESITQRHMTPPNDSIPTISAFIHAQLDWYLTQPFTRNFVEDMLNNHADAIRLINANPVRTFEVAQCPEPDCGGTLYARLRPRDGRLPHDVTCNNSPQDDDGQLTHYWTADQWLTLGRHLTRNQPPA